MNMNHETKLSVLLEELKINRHRSNFELSLSYREKIRDAIIDCKDFRVRRKFMRDFCELTNCVFYTAPSLIDGWDGWDYLPMPEESGDNDVIGGGCALLMATDDYLKKAGRKRWKMLKNLNRIDKLLDMDRDLMYIEGELDPKEILEVT